VKSITDGIIIRLKFIKEILPHQYEKELEDTHPVSSDSYGDAE
jgi:hypothetical protein